MTTTVMFEIGDKVQYASSNSTAVHPIGEVIAKTNYTKPGKAQRILIRFGPGNEKWKYSNDYKIVENGDKQ